MRISAVQFRSLEEADDNIEKAVRFIEREAKKSDLIVFPELFLNCKHPEHTPYLVTMFSLLSKAHKIDIVPGSMLTRRGGKTYNTTYYISRGKVIAKYDKTNLWKTEKLGKGSGPKAFETRFGRTALIICWDLASTEIAARLARMKLDLIICPAMWWQGSESGAKTNFTYGMIDALCLARAYESRAVLAFANVAGSFKLQGFSDKSAGRSQVVAPFRNQICEVEGNKEKVIRCVTDSASLIPVRKYFGRF